MHGALGHLADFQPDTLKTLSLDDLKALLTPEALKSLGLDADFAHELDADAKHALKQLESAFRKKFAVASHHAVMASAADHQHDSADHVADGEHHHLSVGDALGGAVDILGGIPFLIPLLGVAAAGGIVYAVAHKDGHDNHAPVANADAVTTAENAAITFDPRSNDTDSDGDSLTVTQVNGTNISATAPVTITNATGATVGTVALGTDGRLTFTPAKNFFGTPSFTYTVSDGNGGTSTATVSLTVTHVNQAPVTTADVFTTTQNGTVVINVLTNDSDVDGDKLTVTQINGTAISTTQAVAITGGSLILNAAGNLVFTPTTNFSGTVPSFTYTVSDGALTATGTVNGAVTHVNQAPVAVADTFTTTQNSPVVINVLANDTDVDGDKLSVTQVNGTAISATQPVAVTGGSVILNTAGNLVFTPTTNSSGTPSFTYTVSDGALTSTATVSGTVTHVNQAPVAVADTFTTNENASVVINVLANDTDVDGDTLKVTQVNGTAISTTASVAIAGGSLILNAAGNLVFTPAANYFGKPSFTYTVSDGALTSTGTVGGTVNHVNQAPVAVADTFTTLQNTAVVINVLANDTDVDGDTLKVTQVNGTAISTTQAVTLTNATGAAIGSVILNSTGAIVFTPAANFSGTPSFTYTASDGALTSTATVSGTVTHVNQAPVAVADTFTTNENASVVINVLANDTDVDGDTLKVTQVNGTAISTTASVAIAGGSLILNAAGNLVFTPTANFSGTPSFAYTVSDGNGGTATASVSGAVTFVNQAPTEALTASRLSTSAGVAIAVPAITVGDVDSTNLRTTVTAGHGAFTLGTVTGTGAAVSGSGTGTLVLTGTQAQINASLAALKFTGTTGFTGSDTLTVTTSDGLLSTSATIALTIGQVASGFVQDGYISGATVFFDANGNGTLDAGEAIGVTDATGHYVITSDGPLTGNLIAFGGTNIDTGLANKSVLMAPAGSSIINPLTTLVSQVLAANPSFTLQQASNAVSTALGLPPGTDYTHYDFLAANDATSLAVNKAAVQIVTFINSVIAAGGTSASALNAIGTLTSHGGTVDFTSTSIVTNLLMSAGLSQAQADTSAAGVVSISTAIAAATSTAGVTQTVHDLNQTNSNLPPVVGADSAATTAGHSVTIDVLANDKDPEGGSLVVKAVNGIEISAVAFGGQPVAVTGGFVTLGTDGKLTFTPNAGFTGSPSFGYTVADDHGNLTSGLVSVTVTADVAVNHAPVAVADSFTTAENTAITINVLANDTDVDGDKLSVTKVNGTTIDATHPVTVTGGVVSLNTAGNLVFTPTTNTFGTPSFSYTVSDGSGGTSTTTVGGTVTHVNQAPVAVADTFTTAENTAVTINLLANDTDPDGDRLTVTQVNGQTIDSTHSVHVGGGTAILDGVGNVVLTPGINEFGNVGFTYTVSDGHGGTSTGNANGLISPVVTAVADTFTTTENTSVVLNVLANDQNFLLGPLKVTQVNGQSIDLTHPVTITGGSVSLNTAGNLVYTPSLNYYGSPNFTYTATDINGNVSTANVSGNVTFVDHAPVAVNDSFSYIASTSALTIPVLSNDYDVDGDALIITQINGQPMSASLTGVFYVGNGYVDVSSDGKQLSYFLPNANGLVSFTYTVSDGHGGTATATVSGTISGVATTPTNVAPVAVNDSASTALHTPVTIDVLANDTDANHDTLTVTQVNGQALGSAAVAVSGGTVASDGHGHLVFTPGVGTVGNSTFSYTANDGHGGTSTASVTVDTEPTSPIYSVAPGDLPAVVANAAALGAHGVTTVDLSGTGVATITDGDAQTLIAGGLHFAADDHVSLAGSAGHTHLTTTLKGLADLEVSAVAFAGGVTNVSIDAGTSDLGGLSHSTLPHFDPALHVTLDVAGGTLSPSLDLGAVATTFAHDGIDAIGVLGNGSLTLDAAQAEGFATSGLTFDPAANITVTATAAELPMLADAHLAGLNIDTIDVAGAATITDAEAANLIQSGIHFAAGDHVTVDATAGHTHLSTTLKGLADLEVSAIAFAGAGAGVGISIDAGTSDLGGLAHSALPTFDPALHVTLDINPGTLDSSLDLGAVATTFAHDGIDAIGVLGNGSLTLDAAQAEGFATSGLTFDPAANITVTATAAELPMLADAHLAGLNIDTIDVAGAATITDAEAANLIRSGIHFAAGDHVTVDATAGHTHLSTTLKGLADLEVSAIAFAGAGAGVGISIDAGTSDLGGLAHSALPTFDPALHVTLDINPGRLDPTLDLGAVATTFAHDGIDAIGVLGNGSLDISVAQAEGFATSGLVFDPAANVTIDATAANIGGLADHAASLASLNIDQINVTGAASITDAEAAALVHAGLHFANGDTVSVVGSAGHTHLSTTLKGLADLEVSAVAFAGAVSSITIDAGTGDLGSLAHGALPHFDSALHVTLDIDPSQLSSSLDLGSVGEAFHAAGIDSIGVAGGGNLSLTVAQAESFAVSGLTFDPATNVTITASAAEATALADNPFALHGLNVDAIHVTAPTAITDVEAVNLIEAGLHFATGDHVALNVGSAGTHLSTSLKGLHDLNVNSIAVATGVSHIELYAGDLHNLQATDIPSFVTAQTNAAVDVTLKVDISEASEVSRLAAALATAGVDHIQFNQPLSSLTSAQQQALNDALTANHLTATYDGHFSGADAVAEVASGDTLTAADTALAQSSIYRDLLTSFETSSDTHGHGGVMQLADGATSSLAEAGMLRAYTAETLVVDGTTSGDHLLTTLKDIADIGADVVKLAAQSSTAPVYVDLGVADGANAASDIQTLFHNLDLDGHATGTGSIFSGNQAVALVLDADAANALSHTDGAMSHLASLGFTEVDVLATPGASAPAFADTAGLQVKVINADDPLYHHLHPATGG